MKMDLEKAVISLQKMVGNLGIVKSVDIFTRRILFKKHLRS
jgi:hypothetical protein